MLPPCHFLLYSSNTIVTLQKKLTGRVILILKKSNEVFLISATNENKRRNLMQIKILYYQSLPSVTYIANQINNKQHHPVLFQNRNTVDSYKNLFL